QSQAQLTSLFGSREAGLAIAKKTCYGLLEGDLDEGAGLVGGVGFDDAPGEDRGGLEQAHQDVVGPQVRGHADVWGRWPSLGVGVRVVVADHVEAEIVNLVVDA